MLLNVVVLGGLLFFISGYGQGRDVRYWIEFDESILGLNEGSIIEFKGVPVGKVSGIRVTDEGLAHVDVRINPDKVELHEGVTAKLVIYSLATGMMAVSLEGGDATAPRLAPGSRIPNSPSLVTSFLTQIQGAQGLIDDIRAIAQQIRKGLEGVKEGELTEIVRNSGLLITDARHFVETAQEDLKRLTDKAEPGIANFTKLTEDLSVLSHDANTLVKTLQAKIEPMQLAQTEQNVQKALVDLSGALQRLSTTLDTVNGTAQGISARTDNVEYSLRETLTSLQATLESIRTLVDYLNQDPAALIRGRAVPKGD